MARLHVEVREISYGRIPVHIGIREICMTGLLDLFFGDLSSAYFDKFSKGLWVNSWLMFGRSAEFTYLVHQAGLLRPRPRCVFI